MKKTRELTPNELPGNPLSIAFGKRGGEKGGRAGGLKGGPARAASLSPERRSEIAKRATEKRWGKKPRYASTALNDPEE